MRLDNDGDILQQLAKDRCVRRGVGTGGTIAGVGHRLKAAVPNVRIVLADPVGSALADRVESGDGVVRAADALVRSWRLSAGR